MAGRQLWPHAGGFRADLQRAGPLRSAAGRPAIGGDVAVRWLVQWASLDRSGAQSVMNGFQGKLTSSKWASLAKFSRDTANRDISDLVKRLTLAKNAAGRSTSYSLIEPAGKTAPEP